jgi:succinate dehydrogenase hydrophobic anchor subunit
VNEEIGKALVISFHEQFAQNQNHHQNLFLQILTLLISVLIGFGYLYVRVGVENAEINIDENTLVFFLVLSMILLSLSIALIFNMSLGFRRDQMVACNIRVKTNVMNIDDEKSYFPSKFNPLNKVTYVEWLPDFHKIFFIILLLIKILLIASSFSRMSEFNCIIIACLVASLISIAVDLILGDKYRNKWEEYVANAPCSLKK